jgi:hypothetical protein
MTYELLINTNIQMYEYSYELPIDTNIRIYEFTVILVYSYISMVAIRN